MKSSHPLIWKRLNFVVGASLLLLAGSLQAENWVRYEAQPTGSKVKIEGTSTLHDWTVESPLITGVMELDTAFDADLKTLKVKPKVEVSILVRSLKSGLIPMNNVMYEALKQPEHPKIEYKLLELTPKGAQFDAKGALTVAGVTRTNTMPVTMQRVDKTKLKVTGTAALKMTDFGIKPPVLAIVTTGDDVKITFEWLTAQKPEVAKEPAKTQ